MEWYYLQEKIKSAPGVFTKSTLPTFRFRRFFWRYRGFVFLANERSYFDVPFAHLDKGSFLEIYISLIQLNGLIYCLDKKEAPPYHLLYAEVPVSEFGELYFYLYIYSSFVFFLFLLLSLTTLFFFFYAFFNIWNHFFQGGQGWTDVLWFMSSGWDKAKFPSK